MAIKCGMPRPHRSLMSNCSGHVADLLQPVFVLYHTCHLIYGVGECVSGVFFLSNSGTVASLSPHGLWTNELDVTAVPRLQTFLVQTVHARSRVSMLEAGGRSGVSLFGVWNRFFSKAVILLVFSERLVYSPGANAVSVYSVLKALWGRGERAALPQHHIHPFDTSRARREMYSVVIALLSFLFNLPRAHTFTPFSSFPSILLSFSVSLGSHQCIAFIFIIIAAFFPHSAPLCKPSEWI